MFFILLSTIVNNLSLLLEILIVLIMIPIIKKNHISGSTIAIGGFILLTIVGICSLFGFVAQARIIAEYVWIFFAMSFFVEFIHFLRHENK